MSEIITHELLRSWSPCADVYKRFCELFPNGATLPDSVDGLVADNHDNWAKWLFDVCKEKGLFGEYTAKGYWNAGDWNAGYRNAGNWNAGDWNAGNWNAGDWNAGYMNAGDRNAGNWNAGDRNAGNWNAGYMNAGDRNAGDRNAGNWNAGNMNAGYMNAKTPAIITVFDKPCAIEVWEKAKKPNFLFFNTTIWVSESSMTDQEKIDHPKFHVAEGYLKTIPYKEAFQASYAAASAGDRALVKALPNFDADTFFEISGIMVD